MLVPSHLAKMARTETSPQVWPDPFRRRGNATGASELVPSSRLAARLFELSHAQLLEIAVAGCEASPAVTKQAEAILAANNPLAQRLVEGVLLSRDLAPHVLAPLPLEDGAAAAVCSLWAEGWKATSEGRRRLVRVAFDLPADVLEDCHGMAAIPGNDEKLALCSSDKVTILDRSMRVVTSITDVRTDVHEAGGYVQITGSITADEQSIYIKEVLAPGLEPGDHLRITHDGTELARCEDPNGWGLHRNGHCVVAPGGLLFWKGFAREDDDQQGERWDEIFAFDAHSMQLRFQFGKSLFGSCSAASGVGPGGSACGLAVVGEELFVCDMMNDRLQVFSLAGEHRRSVTGEWKQPSSLCVIKDRLYLVESHTNSGQFGPFGPSPYEDNKQTRGRRIFVLSLQGETLQVYPIPARQWNRFSTGELFCFDGKLLVPIGDYEGDGEGEQLMCDYTHLEIVALLGA